MLILENDDLIVAQLVQGHSNQITVEDQHFFRATGSVTLISCKDCKILVDCGNPHQANLIEAGLKGYGLKPDEIHVLICTHGHTDHIGNLNLFSNAKIFLDHDVMLPGGLYQSIDFDTSSVRSKVCGLVDIWSTPGHTSHDLSVVVGVPGNKIVVAGDIFECKEDLDDDTLWMKSSWDVEAQKSSRREILELADTIIPGHGAAFKNYKK